MANLNFGGKAYNVDPLGFLLDPGQWDEDFAVGMAAMLQMSPELTGEHWNVIYSIRSAFTKTGFIPPVYQICRTNGLRLPELRTLFPAGYWRGACKLAGVNYLGSCPEGTRLPLPADHPPTPLRERTYEIDRRGFLVRPEDWDEQFTLFKAHEMKMPQPLIDRHWQIIYFIRDSFQQHAAVPTVYETCEANHLELEDLERLFPDGYHRGAVKLAGLRLRWSDQAPQTGPRQPQDTTDG